SRGGYPDKWAYAPLDSLVDSWGMYNRECVSYTAWKVFQKNGYMPYWGGRGNANQWPANARAAGIPTGSTPKVGSVAVSMSGPYGHTMWVEAVNGNQIYVSQYNYYYNGWGNYSEMWLNASGLIYIYF
ncbi:MAG TPA: CHAP domain-containing protein, partial [Candidatus Saccharibacteria bacterium]|nr:CHAP domain-containing protein [Candidatus Saccharibacteria bacterium]